MAKEKRSNKWTFLFYKESAPENYLEILEELHIPFILSPWHDKDVNSETGEFKKSHKHGVLFFESLKSYSQVSELLTEKLNTPSHVEVVMSPKGMYDYFIHAENPEKTLYNIEDIESGCGFELDKFLIEQNSNLFLETVIDVITDNNFTEFEDLVHYARNKDISLLGLIIERTYFFTKFLDSRRYNPQNNKKTPSETLASEDEVADNQEEQIGYLLISLLYHILEEQMQVILPDKQIQQIQLLLAELIKKEIENRLNNSNLESPFLNKQQACHYLGISNNTLDSWIKRGLPAIKIGKTIRFNKEAINSWLYSQN